MSILVTGAAGFIGYHVSRTLIARGETVIGIDNFNGYYDPLLKQERVAALPISNKDFVCFPVDFADGATLFQTLADRSIDRIIHLGAQPGVRYGAENPAAYISSNLVGHANILEFARSRAVEHMVYASSSSVYGESADLPFKVEARVDHPISLYAATKKADELLSESYAHLYGIPMTGLRFFTVYGPWGRPDMAVWKFTEAVLSGQPIKLYNHGQMRRDFTFIDDIVSGVIAALDRPPADDKATKPGGSIAPHAIYNLGNNRAEALSDLVAAIEAACGRKAETKLCPLPLGDVTATFADITDAARDLGFRPITPISVGVPAFVHWYRDYASRLDAS